jgi:S-adenosylmethionine:tRNA ribosyltransferase-isomerase
MFTSPIDYDLPPHLIAQTPAERRDQSRLLVLHRGSARIEHRRFCDLPDLLSPRDLLVLNDSRVLPARLYGERERTGGKWEGLFLREEPGRRWELLCQTRGRLAPGEHIRISAHQPEAPAREEKTLAGASGLRPEAVLRLELLEKTPGGSWWIRPDLTGSAVDLLARFGQVPLPPYIRKGRSEEPDRERYQTVYARQPGSVAAPTAGLHFTPELLARLDERGIERAFVTLHVGIGTFQPIQVADVRQHRMHAEWCALPQATSAAIAACKARGGRVVAVGTTSVRVLESAALASPVASAPGVPSASAPGVGWSGWTDLFIHPPYPFRAVDALVTNFHLPRSTLLLLVAAFAGVEPMQEAYRVAVEQQYRFYSYGDAMLIV